MDRNRSYSQFRYWHIVALRKESVDRNVAIIKEAITLYPSLSARRAWIEIVCCVGFSSGANASLSARRAWIEITMRRDFKALHLSLSARRAWIEIYYADKDADWVRVALRKESVDRNGCLIMIGGFVVGSLSARRAWIEISTQCRL